ncbi:unnamed protein product [Bemisia tabaci]|uniref:Cytochrome c oxidase subunit 5B, mitochondrial n=1 Tax=Bemisia tabaci TaxID=7038 RepID=A0A9P0A625_BEMTA|nr:PREDICTED: cytochrome c oxidase subunit 5B, mitochondrial-like [Bemisia tabaci]CAH0384836.1 unnamed protein product [Bemisia tabaci]
MALTSALVRSVARVSRRNVYTSAKLFRKEEEDYPDLPDPLEFTTGLQKRIILAELAGNPDPFNVFARKRGPGTKEQPNEVPSAYEARIIGCVCDEDSSHIKWMWVFKGAPKRCMCGNWFKLVYAPPV